MRCGRAADHLPIDAPVPAALAQNASWPAACCVSVWVHATSAQLTALQKSNLAGVQIYGVPLFFTLPHKSAFESALVLMRDVLAGVIHSPRRALLDTVVGNTHAPVARGATARQLAHAVAKQQTMPSVPHVPFDAEALRQSEAILGHKCNADQRAVLTKLRDGIFAVHGPPGTGAAC